METDSLILEIQDCALALFQNREQDAYQKINKILPDMNIALQKFMMVSKEMEEIILAVLKEFVEDFEQKDNLGMADLLGYTIPDILMTMTERE